MEKRWHKGSQDGVFQRYHDGLANDTEFYREQVQDVAPIINAATRIRNETDGRSDGGRLVGRIPSVVYNAWLKEWTDKGMIAPGNMSGLNDLLVARLRDSDYSKFRTTSGGI